MASEFKIISIRKPPTNSLDSHYFVSKFSGDIKFDRNTGATIERENNFKEFKAAYDVDTMPKTGAGSEYGREDREEARRRKYGIKAKKYNPTEQPFILKTIKKDKSSSRKYKGVKNSGVLQNTSYIVLIDQGDHMDVLPVNEFYEFNPVIKHKVLTEAEAEEIYKTREKTLNYFTLMQNKKKEDNVDDEDCDTKDKETCDYMSGSGNDSDDEDGKKNKKKNKKKSRKQRRKEAEDDFDEEEQLLDEAIDDDYNKPSLDYVSDFTSDEDDDDDNERDSDMFGDFEDSEEENEDKNPNANDNNNNDDDDDDKEENEGGKSKLSDDSDSDSSSEDFKESEVQNKLPTSKLEGAPTVADRKRKSEVFNEPSVKKPKLENTLEQNTLDQKVREILSNGAMAMKEFTVKLKAAVPGIDKELMGKTVKSVGLKIDKITEKISLP